MASGASASISNTNLNISYTNITFSGTETLQYSVCDITNSCSEGIITVEVANAPPAISDKAEQTKIGGEVTIKLLSLISDSDNNIDITSLRITQPPVSGAVARIGNNGSLLVDYRGVRFKGTDYLKIEVCDKAGRCSENVVTIEVSGEIETYNAIAPNSSGNNRYMRILYLPEGNKVSIYNRWGDEVYSVENYDNDTPGKRFEGLNNNGSALPAGTYFYKIDFTDGSKTLTGYLTLQQ